MKQTRRSSDVEVRGSAHEQNVEGPNNEPVESRRQSGISQRPPAAALPASDWNATVVAEILGFEYARSVMFTDGQGKLLFSGGSPEATVDLAEAADIAFGAVIQGSQSLNLGELETSIWLCRQGTVVSMTKNGIRAVVLAQADADLAQLLSHVRRVFAGRHE